MKPHPIKELIAQGEHQHLDFKYEISDAAKIARTLAAFANTAGGKLLIGVKDNGVIKGVSSDEEYFMIQNAAQRFCRPEVHFTSREWIVDGKKVLEIDVPFSKQYPFRAPDHNGNYKAYVRVKDQNLLANGVLMKVWAKRKSNKKIRFVYSRPVQEILFYLRENPFLTLPEAISLSGLSRYKTEHLLSDLILLEVIEMEISETNEIYRLTPASE
jgi:predicted HTH transcriptional regulator